MNQTIFERLRAGEIISHTDADFHLIHEACAEVTAKRIAFNNEEDAAESQVIISSLLGTPLPNSSFIAKPFHVNYGKNIHIGENVYINMNCTMLGLGGITIENRVLIAPSVNISSEGHPTAPSERGKLHCQPVLIKEGAWIGMGANILPNVTIGRNAIVAAGAVVTKDVPDNAVVAGVPAKIIKILAE